ncbi:MAG: cobalamin-independent methionine synthase II family protein [Pseudomonadota bacterium]|nr:cobalamin-independent methionine synthase II family protein [Pseudomonadota bacterium]
MKKSQSRILTTHAGSLPRPLALTDLYAKRAKGQSIDDAALATMVSTAVSQIVPKQIEAGLDVVNNGEQSREAFFLYVQHRMSGFEPGGSRQRWRDVTRYSQFYESRERALKSRNVVSNMAPPKVTGEVSYLDPTMIESECLEFKQVLDAHRGDYAEAFMTAPSPGIIASAIPNQHYDSFSSYLQAITNALAHEYHCIVDKGFILQLDCPDLAMERHISFADRPINDFIEFVEQIIDAINGALVSIPPEQVRLHVCWGNYEGPHDLDVPLDDILKPILDARVGAFLFPLANPRHAHEHRCFRGDLLRDDQLLIAGVIDTTTNYIEHPQVVADRIVLAAQAIGNPQRVLAGTDCGFDTSAGMGRVSEDIVWAKLRALHEGAALATEQLF